MGIDATAEDAPCCVEQADDAGSGELGVEDPEEELRLCLEERSATPPLPAAGSSPAGA